MINDRPIDDPKLQIALNEVKAVMARYGFAGTCMLVGPEEAAFFYKMHAPWSALRFDPETPLGFRITAKSRDIGKEAAHQRVEAAVHTICQMSDYGEQTAAWMEDLKLAIRRAGIDFDHTPFNGKPLQHLVFGKPPDGAI
jgi:hypothetical protein